MNILLLTSTIQPNPNQPQLSLINPEERLKDYQTALEFYEQQLDSGWVDKIVYVDNSGYDLRCLSDRFKSKNIEWISFYGLDYPNTYHRGYGEFKLIDHAFSNSIILQEMGDADVVWKLTGRYIIKNLANVIRLAPKKFDLYCDIKNNWISMEILAWNRLGYKTYIKGAWQNFATGMAPELILSDSIKNNLDAAKVITKYYWPPFIIGRRGSNGSNFKGRFTPVKYWFLLVYKFALLKIRWLRNIFAK